MSFVPTGSFGLNRLCYSSSGGTDRGEFTSVDAPAAVAVQVQQRQWQQQWQQQQWQQQQWHPSYSESLGHAYFANQQINIQPAVAKLEPSPRRHDLDRHRHGSSAKSQRAHAHPYQECHEGGKKRPCMAAGGTQTSQGSAAKIRATSNSPNSSPPSTVPRNGSSPSLEHRNLALSARATFPSGRGAPVAADDTLQDGRAKHDEIYNDKRSECPNEDKVENLCAEDMAAARRFKHDPDTGSGVEGDRMRKECPVRVRDPTGNRLCDDEKTDDCVMPLAFLPSCGISAEVISQLENVQERLKSQVGSYHFLFAPPVVALNILLQ